MTEASPSDPLIAVVGMSCRLPRAPSPEGFWGLLESEQHAVGEIPGERWELAGRQRRRFGDADPGARFGAFLDRVDRFDPTFFGISPREAAAMDPQQRLVLELGWEALEDAGVVPSSISGQQAGVFLGAIASDYSHLSDRLGAGLIGRHTVTGLNRSIIANRVSYALGLTGPSMTVDAAQSSSLVAVHLACESLHRGEADFALAGGVHLNIDPQGAVGAARFGGLSPDGRCFTFDARANGYVRGEGGGVVVLKPFAAARADGDRIYCVIRGSAVNNDGPSDGLTVPSQSAQESVVRRAYARSGVKRSEVQYVELHGSGTVVGDPIEAAALGSVLGSKRTKDDPLPVGSAKTNVGHLEGAAGIAGLIKAILAIDRRLIPASLNFSEPNPKIPLEDFCLRVQDSLGAWPDDERPLVAGVSSFGMGGTNCHLVVAEAPGQERVDGGASRLGVRPRQAPIPLALSAKTEPALKEAASRLVTHLKDNPDQELKDVAYSLTTTRATFNERAVALGSERGELVDALSALAEGKESPNLTRGKASSDRAPVFLFPGQGAQWTQMAMELVDGSELFATHIEE
ncbi:MAG TPA: beta-ketoacyl synthase N-terminal-like domain-containing protein, partial [Candidatus Dormibacteraeota bacterium]